MTSLISEKLNRVSHTILSTHKIKTNSWTLTLDHVTWKSFRKLYSLGTSTATAWQPSSRGGKRYWADNICTKNSSLTFTLDHMAWTSIGDIYLLWASTHQVWRLSGKGVERFWADICTKTGSLILTPDHVTWKSIRNNRSLGASITPSLATFKHWGKKILSEHHLVYRPTYWLTCGKQHAPIFKGGIKII